MRITDRAPPPGKDHRGGLAKTTTRPVHDDPTFVPAAAERDATAITIRTGVWAGGMSLNHNQSALHVRTGVQAGGLYMNHNQLPVRFCPACAHRHARAQRLIGGS